MRSSKLIHVVSCHAEGEVGDVIVGGVTPPPGDTLWEQRTWIANDETLRNFMLNEPRGGVFRHINLLVPAKHPDAQMGWIIMEPSDTPPMSGSNAICVSTVLLDSGIIPMQYPFTDMTLEAPGGLVKVRAECSDGKAQRIAIKNLPSFVDKHNVKLNVGGIGDLEVSIAFGGDSFVVVDASILDLSIEPSAARHIAELGVRITNAANEQLTFSHPNNPDWSHISFCLFAGPITRNGNSLSSTSAVSIKPGKVDRSPTGTAVSARMALLHATGEMQVEDTFVGRSILGSEFHGRIAELAIVGDKPAIIPEISGRGWITGVHQHTLDPDDPWPQGYRLNDTWPAG